MRSSAVEGLTKPVAMQAKVMDARCKAGRDSSGGYRHTLQSRSRFKRRLSTHVAEPVAMQAKVIDARWKTDRDSSRAHRDSLESHSASTICGRGSLRSRWRCAQWKFLPNAARIGLEAKVGDEACNADRVWKNDNRRPMPLGFGGADEQSSAGLRPSCKRRRRPCNEPGTPRVRVFSHKRSRKS